jgi:hypothetical protein
VRPAWALDRLRAVLFKASFRYNYLPEERVVCAGAPPIFERRTAEAIYGGL